MSKSAQVSINELRELLSYAPATGVISWKVDRGLRVRAGDEFGCVSKANGYRFGSFKYTQLNAHRVAWALHYGEWPQGDVDHKNLLRHDNRIENLRACTRRQNIANMNPTKANKSGFKGVSMRADTGKWTARIRAGGRYLALGCWDRAEDAAAAYAEAAKRYHGEFARV